MCWAFRPASSYLLASRSSARSPLAVRPAARQYMFASTRRNRHNSAAQWSRIANSRRSPCKRAMRLALYSPRYAQKKSPPPSPPSPCLSVLRQCTHNPFGLFLAFLPWRCFSNVRGCRHFCVTILGVFGTLEWFNIPSILFGRLIILFFYQCDRFYIENKYLKNYRILMKITNFVVKFNLYIWKITVLCNSIVKFTIFTVTRNNFYKR